MPTINNSDGINIRKEKYSSCQKTVFNSNLSENIFFQLPLLLEKFHIISIFSLIVKISFEVYYFLAYLVMVRGKRQTHDMHVYRCVRQCVFFTHAPEPMALSYKCASSAPYLP